MGAIASGGVRVLNPEVLDLLPIPAATIEAVTQRELRELGRREELYRAGRPPLDVRGKTVILVDDGLATGASMRAATAALRLLDPAEIVIAVPIAAPETCQDMQLEVDRVVCAVTPEPFRAVGLWYADFSQTTDEEVRDLLQKARAASPAGRVDDRGHRDSLGDG